jgi:hypothetical protein
MICATALLFEVSENREYWKHNLLRCLFFSLLEKLPTCFTWKEISNHAMCFSSLCPKLEEKHWDVVPECRSAASNSRPYYSICKKPKPKATCVCAGEDKSSCVAEG